ncbi:hypothetical protein CW751_01555 [Brumimicrobium salinarum]|uniref:histidine kinase n=1 Tax=Brumimicrobium salinarum TaxID=2058658 RepID=A0A2I0R6Q5_9FLAO|nr:histidine kinase dimerization/phosphoacceptor domain -containing protein [Brumimicrobium salinarum]PKR82050.1 hypothetical protein CW751_01555 [Brumimicrobium salinarum]
MKKSIEYTDFQDKAKFKFVFRITLTFTVFSILLTIASYLNGDVFSYFYGMTFLLMLIGVITLQVFKVYKTVATLLFSFTSLVLCTSVFYIDDALHIQEALWMVVIILSAFFTLGKVWGVILLVFNVFIYVTYYNFLFRETMDERLDILPNSLFLMSIEFSVSMFLIGYVMFQYSLVNEYALKSTSKAYNELKKEKQTVERQNKEKTVLLQEIHHRVKNNLQVIVSLLRIQSKDLKSEEAKSSFQDAISRVLTMSLIHQKLYEKKSLVDVNIKDYINSLMDNLIKTGSVGMQIEYSLNSSLKSVSAKSIVPLGLIVNELVSNSIKHAFDKKGRIELSILSDNDSQFEMIYFDNGNWKENENETFGTQLIEIFTEQLDGTFSRKTNASGTFYHFNLNQDKKENNFK